MLFPVPWGLAVSTFFMLQFTFSAALNGTIRTYYVGAVEEDWDYMPTGIDLINGVEIDQSPQAAAVAAHNGQRIGHVYTKAMFREFTDDTFAVQARRPQWLGMLGPVIRAEVGDTVEVIFKNMASNNHSMHPHGLRYSKPNEGVAMAGQEFSGNSVPPGETWTYTWEVPERAGRASGESLGPWLSRKQFEACDQWSIIRKS
ncbi:hypothetical protein DTO217A2_545 [Paecilomyces variotii]|nr:hypothetical protein DTO217A2_545 [Paecilomyces variotii]